MAENRFSCGAGRETVCIDTNRVLDSCRDRDCFENVRVYLSDFCNGILEHTGAIRARSAKIIGTHIGLDAIPFNRGFYAVTIRFYIRLTFEACVGGGRSQELEGVSVLEKRVILYGGEGGTNVFKSDCRNDDFCGRPTPGCGERNMPTAVVEVVDPVILGARIMEKAADCNCCCCCQENDLPDTVVSTLDAPLIFDDETGKRYLSVSLGIFSVIRIVRPTQILVQATEYCIPEKECTPVEEDEPCNVFRTMPFPVNEFCNGSVPPVTDRHCGCKS